MINPNVSAGWVVFIHHRPFLMSLNSVTLQFRKIGTPKELQTALPPLPHQQQMKHLGQVMAGDDHGTELFCCEHDKETKISSLICSWESGTFTSSNHSCGKTPELLNQKPCSTAYLCHDAIHPASPGRAFSLGLKHVPEALISPRNVCLKITHGAL